MLTLSRRCVSGIHTLSVPGAQAKFSESSSCHARRGPCLPPRHWKLCNIVDTNAPWHCWRERSGHAAATARAGRLADFQLKRAAQPRGAATALRRVRRRAQRLARVLALAQVDVGAAVNVRVPARQYSTPLRCSRRPLCPQAPLPSPLQRPGWGAPSKRLRPRPRQMVDDARHGRSIASLTRVGSDRRLPRPGVDELVPQAAVPRHPHARVHARAARPPQPPHLPAGR